MFWSDKKKHKDTDKRKEPKELQAIEGDREGTSKSQRIREEALANARAARAQIGEDTLDKIAAAMTKKQQSATEQAKAQIKAADSDRVVDEILAMIDED
ncbi:MAG: hypothetical protein DHS20C02_15560 [Micavibrio sp.]|nr:MAG: hypothetical protein DHS20C02_15560 [Micavibrio sp.]